MEFMLDLPNGAVASRRADGVIFVTGGHGARQVDANNPVGLMPVLELDPRAGSDEATRALPISEVLTLALTWKTTADHWPRLAIEWLARNGVSDALKPTLAAFAQSDRGSQKTRGDARRLLRDSQ